jgi:hypothetical protein
MQTGSLPEHIQVTEDIMKLNMGTTDSMVRVFTGCALACASLFGAIGPWGWIGILLMATGIFRFCPAYYFLHFSMRHEHRYRHFP